MYNNSLKLKTVSYMHFLFSSNFYLGQASIFFVVKALFVAPIPALQMQTVAILMVFTFHFSVQNYGKKILKQLHKYSSVFRDPPPPRCSPPPKPVYDGSFSHEAVTLKIRSRSPKSNKLLILSDLYRLANLVTFHLIVHEITCRQTLFGLILVD